MSTTELKIELKLLIDSENDILKVKLRQGH